jgi:hypothetical protein
MIGASIPSTSVGHLMRSEAQAAERSHRVSHFDHLMRRTKNGTPANLLRIAAMTEGALSNWPGSVIVYGVLSAVRSGWIERVSAGGRSCDLVATSIALKASLASRWRRIIRTITRSARG